MKKSLFIGVFGVMLFIGANSAQAVETCKVVFDPRDKNVTIPYGTEYIFRWTTTGCVTATILGGWYTKHTPGGVDTGVTGTLPSGKNSGTTGILTKKTTFKITALGVNGKSKDVESITINVAPQPKTLTTIVVTKSSSGNKIQQFKATAKDQDGKIMTGKTFVWTSSAPTVATVDSTGKVTAVSVGTTTITASSGGKSGTNTTSVVLITR